MSLDSDLRDIIKRKELYVATEILKQSKIYVPVETGLLRSTGVIRELDGRYNVIYSTKGRLRLKRYKSKVFRAKATIAKEYAPIVEYNTKARHKPPTKAFYLRDSVIEVMNRLGLKQGVDYIVE